jgi:hypothetical protein
MKTLLKIILPLVILILAVEGFSASWNKTLRVGSPNLDASSAFQVNSTTKGSTPLPIQTTGERTAISSPDEAIMSWDTTLKIPYAYNGTGWSQFILDSATQTLTNKTIDADSNTITNIENADIKAAAAIARSKLADGTANYVLINNGTGGMSEEQYLDKTRGGTGITSTATFPTSGTVMTRTATEDISGKTFLDALLLTELGATPSTPSAGDKKVYCLTDDKCYQLNDAGVETELGAGGAGGGVNALTDGSFETDVSNVTATVGTATSESTTVYHKADGKSLKIALSAQTADIEQVETYTEWAGTNVEISCFVKSSSATVNLCSTDGTNDILCVDYDGTDIWKKVVTSMTVGTGGQMGWHFTTDSSITDDIFADECTAKALEPGVEAAIGAWELYTDGCGGSWSGAVTYTCYKRRVGDTIELNVKVDLTGAPTGTALELNFPTGITPDSNKMHLDTENYAPGKGSIWDATGEIYQITGHRTTATTYFNPQVDDGDGTTSSMSATNPVTFANGDQVNLLVSFPVVGWNSSTQFLTQPYGWYVDANIGGANPDLGTSSVSTYTGITNGSLDLVN